MQELIENLCMLLQRENCYSDTLKEEMIIILSEFNIEKKSTEVTVYNDDNLNMEILKKFLISKTVAGLTERTIRMYKTTMLFVFARIEKSVLEMTSDDIKLYLAIRQMRDGVTATTANNEWHCMSSFFGWLHREELIEKNPIYKVDCPKLRKIKKKAFSNMECERIRDNCNTLREKAIVEMLFSTWCRVTEIEQMDIDDIDNDEIKVVGKGKKERIVYINSKAQLALSKYLESRDDNSRALFVSRNKPYNRLLKSSIEKTVREIGERANVDNVHPHRFRRTGATMALKSGMPIETVSHLLGHESVATTQIYLDICEDDMKQSHKKWVK